MFLKYQPQTKFTQSQLRYMRIKRVLGTFMALALLIVMSPVMLAAAIWIKCESKGPVIYKQKRPGYHQRIFTIYKFRSMRTETIGKDGHLLSDRERMTKSGEFLRKTSIDELPQLVNIIKGDMQFIGPRPFLINDLGTYNQKQLVRFDVLPGITSWTAIHGRNNQSVQSKYNQEIYYVKHISFKLDMYVFFKTISLVFSQKDIEDHMNDGRIAAEIMSDMKEITK